MDSGSRTAIKPLKYIKYHIFLTNFKVLATKWDVIFKDILQNTENLEVCLNTLFKKFSNVEPHIFAENVNFSQFVGKIRSGDQA